MVVKKFDQISLLHHEWPDIVPVPEYEVLYRLRTHWTQCFVGWVNGFKYWFVINIEQGYLHDGQSGPQIAWCMFRPDGPVRIAALAHDALYQSAGGTRDNLGVSFTFSMAPVGGQHRIKFSRMACDQVYREFFIQSAPRFRRRAQFGYAALRIAGEKYFGSDDRPNAKKFVAAMSSQKNGCDYA